MATNTSQDTTEGIQEAVCQAFHPVDGNDSVTVFSFKVPAPIVIQDETATETMTMTETVTDTQTSSSSSLQDPVISTVASSSGAKEAFFHICLDVSGSMAGSGINCAKAAMSKLIDHLEASGVPANRITVYTFQSTCTIRRWGEVPRDREWLESVRAGGGNQKMPFLDVFYLHRPICSAEGPILFFSHRGLFYWNLTPFFLSDKPSLFLSRYQIRKCLQGSDSGR